jgi:hypothetical protein
MTELHPPADPAGPPEPAGPPGSNGPTRTRRLVRVVLGLCVVGLTVHLLLPQVGELQQTLATLRSANWGWLALGLLASALTYAVAGASIVAAVRRPLPVGRTSAVQLAASFTVQLGPGALGRLAINQRYLDWPSTSATWSRRGSAGARPSPPSGCTAPSPRSCTPPRSC